LFPSVITYYSEPLVLERGKDMHLYDVDGREYLDFFGGILTIIAGHCNDTVTEALVEQARKLQHASTLFPTIPQAELAEKLAGITPGRLQKSFFTNSGTEANETAILMARAYTGRHEVIALRHAYSGRSALAMSLTAHSAWRLGGLPAPGIVHAHNAYCYRCPFEKTYPECNLVCARDIEELIRTATSGRLAAFIAEPIQGVGGFITPPREYFSIVAEIIRRYGGVFISDEVQTGFGRTGGKWFGIEHWGVQPDMITAAKGMANGSPVGVTVATPEIADSLKGLTISTFGGNPVGARAAKATIDLIESENLMENARVTGQYLRERLKELQEKHPIIGDVRGMGLMQGVELVKDRKTKVPAAEEMARLMDLTKENGLIIGKGGICGNVARISPALTCSRRDVDDAILLLDRSFGRLQ
ncbi:MAG TPA: aspartate aminotransferase family protein, partial [Acidobacteriota bacterium]|nr:aspartate aminotransferase family protein [Acidobacteriota bacterium]